MTPLDSIVAELAALSQKEREELFAELFGYFCFDCGKALEGQRCHCENDE